MCVRVQISSCVTHLCVCVHTDTHTHIHAYIKYLQHTIYQVVYFQLHEHCTVDVQVNSKVLKEHAHKYTLGLLYHYVCVCVCVCVAWEVARQWP